MINQIYKEIINRFPIGRLAMYILNNKSIDKNDVIEKLILITKKQDSDRCYTDDQSVKDAQSFINRLKEL